MECYTSRIKLFGLLVLTVVMVGTSYICTTLDGVVPRAVGWIGVAFFGLGFVVFPIMFFRRGPQVVISDEGLEDRRLRVGLIPWSDVRSVSIGSVNSAKFLCLELDDPDKYLSRLPRWKRFLAGANKTLGFSAVTISFSRLSPGIKEVAAYLQTRGW